MNDLTVFTFDARPVRTLLIDGEPWWVLADVCDVLGIGNPRMVSDRLEDEEKSTVSLADGAGGPPRTIVNESGLYAVILRSDKPEARAFRRWITAEVLPAIRATGRFGVPAAPQGPELIALAVIEAQRLLAAKDERIAELEPMAQAAEAIALATDGKTISDVGKINGLGPHRLGDLLEEAGVFFRSTSGDRVPHQEHIEAGRFFVRERVYSGKSGAVHRRSQTYVTGKGEIWIARLHAQGRLGSPAAAEVAQ